MALGDTHNTLRKIRQGTYVVERTRTFPEGAEERERRRFFKFGSTIRLRPRGGQRAWKISYRNIRHTTNDTDGDKYEINPIHMGLIQKLGGVFGAPYFFEDQNIPDSFKEYSDEIKDIIENNNKKGNMKLD